MSLTRFFFPFNLYEFKRRQAKLGLIDMSFGMNFDNFFLFIILTLILTVSVNETKFGKKS